MRVVHRATLAKKLWLQNRGWPTKSNFTVRDYGSCGPPHLPTQRNSSRENKHLYHFGSLWAVGLPYVEFHVFFLYRPFPIVAWGHAMSEWPHNPVYCIFPSGQRTLASVFALNNVKDMTSQGRKWKHRRGIATSARIYCPIPRNEPALEELTLPSTGSRGFEVDVFHRGERLVLSLCSQTHRYVNLTACTQPLWDVDRDVVQYPHFIEDWVVHHKLAGFDRMCIYDLFGNRKRSFQALSRRLQPWLRSRGGGGGDPFVQLTYGFCLGTLCRAVMKTRRMLYGLGAVAHDHCLFINQLRSAWIEIVHAPHMYIVVNETRFPRQMQSFLAQHSKAHVAEVSVRRVEVFGPKLRENVSLVLSFNAVMLRTFVRANQAPILNPLFVLAQLQHTALAVASGDFSHNNVSLVYVDPADVVAWHFRESSRPSTAPRKDARAPNDYLAARYPRLHQAVLRELHHLSRQDGED